MPTELAFKVKGYRFNMGKLPFRYHPLPQEDELLSSWIVRTAFFHLTDPATFVNLYLPEWKNIFWMSDIDVSADEHLLQRLADKSSFTYELLYSLTLKSYEGYLLEHITGKTRNPFIQSLGRHCRVKVNHGLRFCPLCLKEDEHPYFKKKWRLSFSTACLKHKCFLKDRCAKCGSAVNPYRTMRERDSGISYCYKCGADLRQESVEQISEGSYGLWAIKRLYEILESGVYTVGSGYIYSFLFFDVLRLFVRLVYYWGRIKGLLDHEMMRGHIDFHTQKLRNNLVENIPLKEQYLLFSGLVRLFEGYPGRVLSFCGANRLRGSDLMRDMKYISFWWQWIVDGTLYHSYMHHKRRVQTEI